ncbi:14-3-3-like protein [Oopsacas minuta]|uniref:14-3-3-like protein n=1 Tax=Oopsacas minuta TaxID=111878 RepID=A0AAV7JK27_9METZ|nr:14-3-3-like protein [Oopsacas minuta]
MAETFFQRAKYAQVMERYEDMRKFMEKCNRNQEELLEDNKFHPRERRDGQAKNKDQKLTIIKKFKSAIEEDLDEIIHTLLNLIDSYKLCNAHFEGKDDPNLESNVFYSKMKWDYYRYMAEYKSGDERKIVAEKASEVYKKLKKLQSPCNQFTQLNSD